MLFLQETATPKKKEYKLFVLLLFKLYNNTWKGWV